MSKVLIEEQTLYDIGGAIRDAFGTNTTYLPSDMPSAISAFQTASTVRPSLLPNWDFTRPLNTAGRSSYTGTNYARTIDGWHTEKYTTVIDLTTDGLRISDSSGTNYANLYSQIKYSQTYLNNKTMTISAIINDTLRYSTFVFKPYGTDVTGNMITFAFNGLPNINVGFYRDNANQQAFGITIPAEYLGSGGSVLVRAMKLEFGDSQTLGVQTSDSVYMLSHQDVDYARLIGYHITSSTSDYPVPQS